MDDSLKLLLIAGAAYFLLRPGGALNGGSPPLLSSGEQPSQPSAPPATPNATSTVSQGEWEGDRGVVNSVGKLVQGVVGSVFGFIDDVA
jgi:hypothetical protein